MESNENFKPNIVRFDEITNNKEKLISSKNTKEQTLENQITIVDIKLDPVFYAGFEDDDEFDSIDNWERPSFEGLVTYDVEKAIKILMNQMEVSDDDIEDSMTRDDAAYMMALEYFGYNVSGAFVGDYTPLHLFIEETE
jgi:hypothetical protein